MSKHETGRSSRPSSSVLLSFFGNLRKVRQGRSSQTMTLVGCPYRSMWSVVIAVDASVCIRRPKQHTFAIGNFLTCTNTPPSRKNHSRPIKAWVLLPAQALVEQSTTFLCRSRCRLPRSISRLTFPARTESACALKPILQM
jgi:hypothetical protein